MSEMIELVAKAIYEGRNGPGAKPWASQPKVHRAFYLLDARVAIEAMREPGHELTAAVVAPCEDRSEAVRIWQAMIDAALTGGK